MSYKLEGKQSGLKDLTERDYPVMVLRKEISLLKYTLEDPLRIAQISRPGEAKGGLEPRRIVLVLREGLEVKGKINIEILDFVNRFLQ